MSRLEKKCLIASAGTHCLLLLFLLISPAFLTAKQEEPDLPILKLIPTQLTDQPFSSGGGNPAPPTPAPPPQQLPPPVEREPEPPPPQPQPEPQPEPKPAKVEKQPAPEPAREIKPTVKKTPAPAEPKPKRTRPKVTPELVKADRDSARERTDVQARAREVQRQLANRIGAITDRLERNLSSGTEIAIPGPGSAAYANYAQVVKSKYYQAWVAPAQLAGSSAVVEARVEIARNGKVISARILKGSGDAALDASVERALQLREIAPFPPGAKDSKRVFIIDFTLKSR